MILFSSDVKKAFPGGERKGMQEGPVPGPHPAYGQGDEGLGSEDAPRPQGDLILIHRTGVKTLCLPHVPRQLLVPPPHPSCCLPWSTPSQGTTGSPTCVGGEKGTGASGGLGSN